MATQTFTSSDTWQAPVNVFNIQAECWGGGATGGTSQGSGGHAGNGGGGGAYAKSISIIITPGITYTVTVGGISGTTRFTGDSSVKCEAIGATGQTGALSSSCTGDVKYSGGNGGNGGSPNDNFSPGGGGGEGACTTQNGHDAWTDDTYPSPYKGGTGCNGGDGGSATNLNGDPGYVPGGGGAGGSYNYGSKGTGGAGAAGQIILTWYPSTSNAFLWQDF